METKGTSNEELLQLGITAARRKNKQNARVLFLQVYERDKRNETAMLWLAKVASNRQESIAWLERVVDVNPENETAKKGLEQLRYKQAADENRTLLLFGSVAVFMILLVALIIFIVLSS